MTGLECLREALRQAGATTAQANSKVVEMTLGILAEQPGLYSDEARLLSEIHTLESKRNQLLREIERLKSEKSRLDKTLADFAESEIKPLFGYIDRFLEAISKGETPQGRDALKCAQMFVNSVNVDTKYDNTAFIIGLAQILSCGKIDAIDELRKVNHKIPAVRTPDGNIQFNKAEDGSVVQSYIFRRL